MSREEWTEWRIVGKKPEASKFVAWESRFKTETVARARLASWRRDTTEPGWDFKLQSRTVTKEATAWR